LEYTQDALKRLTHTAQEETSSLGIPELDPFCAVGVITRVHATLTSGKEGTVYCCRAHPSTRRKFLAAKVYREHAASSHKWSQTYFEGRERVLAQKHIRAIHARTQYGQALARALWVSAEFETLGILHQAGVCVPEPVKLGNRSILMEYIGNGAGPAPQLRGLRPTRSEAQDILDQILDGVVGMLRCHLVHGDLSPYNVLVWEGAVRIIDVPQAVDARFNHSAFDLLQRDLVNVCAFFTPFGLKMDTDRLATDLWQQYKRATL